MVTGASATSSLSDGMAQMEQTLRRYNASCCFEIRYTSPSRSASQFGITNPVIQLVTHPSETAARRR